MNRTDHRVLESNLVTILAIVVAVAFVLYLGIHLAGMFAGIAAELDTLRTG